MGAPNVREEYKLLLEGARRGRGRFFFFFFSIKTIIKSMVGLSAGNRKSVKVKHSNFLQILFHVKAL